MTSFQYDSLLYTKNSSHVMSTGHENHLALQMDVTQQNDINGVIATAQDRFGEPPSLLVNNAGIARGSPFHLMEEKVFDTVVDVNLKVDDSMFVVCEMRPFLT